MGWYPCQCGGLDISCIVQTGIDGTGWTVNSGSITSYVTSSGYSATIDTDATTNYSRFITAIQLPTAVNLDITIKLK